MSKQINNALSISRESGKSVKLEMHTASHNMAQPAHAPPKGTNDRQQFSVTILRKIRSFANPALKFLLFLPAPLNKSQPGFLERNGARAGPRCPGQPLRCHRASSRRVLPGPAESGLDDCHLCGPAGTKGNNYGQVKESISFTGKKLPWGTRTWLSIFLTFS